MQSAKRRALMRLSILLPALLSCGACVAGASISSVPSACSSLLPSEWLKGVPGVDISNLATVGELGVALDAMTGQLDIANDRYNAAVGIVSRCEERDREAVKRSKRGFLGL